MKSEQENYEKVKNDITRQKENADYLQAFVDDMNALKLASGEYDELVNQKKNLQNQNRKHFKNIIMKVKESTNQINHY